MDKKEILKIQLACEVVGNYNDVMQAFDRSLFEALAPAYPPMQVEAFTGSKTGDTVALVFTSPYRMRWVSKITAHGQDDHKAWFVDEGVELPFGLSYWKHHHIVEDVDQSNSIIKDEIYFAGKNRLHSYLLYPALYLAFSARKPKYKQYFRSKR